MISRAISRVPFLFAAVLFIGCSLPVDFAPQEEVFLQLHVTEAGAKISEQARFGSLIVREATADSFVNSHRILFSDDPLEMGYYRFASWVEPPTSQVTALLLERLESSGIFRAVTRLSGSTVGELQLNSEILDFYHDIDDSPGVAVIRIRFELIDTKKREMIARHVFEERVPVEDFNSRGAVLAMSQGVERILAAVVTWLSER